MREIKFRAWLQNLAQILQVECIDITSGKLTVLTANIPKKIRISARLNDQKEAVYWYGENAGGNQLMQFTGLLDKNGKEIYEGDIVKDMRGFTFIIKTGWRTRGLSPKGIIKYYGVYGKQTDRDGDEEVLDLEDCEIIGNIYENKEFLNLD